ncbi:MAG: hypothetical protein EAY81_02460 [Bacteroidetes bacterium]|nr:MAG: hypothetical protein EAY81_02460 [Bacteroidota bacterium]
MTSNLKYQLTHQLNNKALANDGYTIITGAFSQLEVAAFLTALEQVMFDVTNNDVCREEVGGDNYVSGIDNLSRQAHPEFLKLNAHPIIQSLLQQIYSKEYTIIQDFAVTKTLGASSKVSWHRDIHPERWDHNYMLGIYLHDSAAEEGALTIIPDSHNSWLDICKLQTMPSVCIPMKAGDILIHDMRLAHSSPPLTTWEKRYVVYLEITSTQYALTTYGEALVESRKLLAKLSKEANNGCYSELIPAHRQLIYDNQFKPLPSLYCFEHMTLKS